MNYSPRDCDMPFVAIVTAMPHFICNPSQRVYTLPSYLCAFFSVNPLADQTPLPQSPPHLPGMRYFAARSGWQFVDLAELWRFRELVWILGLRDLQVRYRQTAVGIAWSVIQPVTTLAIFATMFTLLGQSPVAEGQPYLVSVFCGLLPWQLFATTVSQCSTSLIDNQNLVTKVYIPRLVIPLSKLLVGLVDFGIAMVILILLAMWFGVWPHWGILALPLFTLLACLASLALGIWLSALNAIYRDFVFVVPFVLQTGFFVSPVVYETRKLIPEAWRGIYSLNPMVGVIEGFRWCILGGQAPLWDAWVPSFIALAVVLVSGLFYFRRMERFFSDRI